MSSSFFVFFKVFSRGKKRTDCHGRACALAMTGVVEGCADSPGYGGDRWGVRRNGHNRSLHGGVRIRLDTVMICGAYCGTARGPFPTLGFRGFAGARWGVRGTVDARSLHWGSSMSYTSLNAQGNDPTYSGTTTTAPIAVWVCIGCRKTVQPELHR